MLEKFINEPANFSVIVATINQTERVHRSPPLLFYVIFIIIIISSELVHRCCCWCWCDISNKQTASLNNSKSSMAIWCERKTSAFSKVRVIKQELWNSEWAFLTTAAQHHVKATWEPKFCVWYKKTPRMIHCAHKRYSLFVVFTRYKIGLSQHQNLPLTHKMLWYTKKKILFLRKCCFWSAVLLLLCS